MACAACASLPGTDGKYISLFPQVSPAKAPQLPRHRSSQAQRYFKPVAAQPGRQGSRSWLSSSLDVARGNPSAENTWRRVQNEEVRRRRRSGLRSHNKANYKGRSHARHSAGKHACQESRTPARRWVVPASRWKRPALTQPNACTTTGEEERAETRTTWGFFSGSQRLYKKSSNSP